MDLFSYFPACISNLPYLSCVSGRFLIYFELKRFKLKIIILLIFSISLGCKNKTERREDMPLVYISQNGSNYQLIRNGKPFYIKGGAAHPEFLEELKEAGANTARIYDTIDLRNVLDRAYSLDLAVVADIPLPKFHTDATFYEDEEEFSKMKTRIQKVVRKHKDHPALLYWNLGNELYYPYFYKNTEVRSKFNILIDLIHEIDPNHPVSTVTIGANKLRVISIKRKSPQLDFISFNAFGVLSKFSKKLKPLYPVWNGPHVITEWGVNGPWEAQTTSWNAPIEETSTKKAEQIKQRYYDYMDPLKEENSFGSFIFYWGQKNEVTPTWYSLFSENKMKTQAIFEMERIWKNEKNKNFPGPELEYLLLDSRGAGDNVVLLPGAKAKVEVKLPANKNQNLQYEWEIRKESWSEFHISEVVDVGKFEVKGNTAKFNTPMEEGPYRVFLNLTNGTKYIATANIPFYILNPSNGE